MPRTVHPIDLMQCYCGPKGVQCWILVQYGHDMFKINELQNSASRKRHVSRGQGLYLTWEHKHSLKLLGIFVAIAKKYIVWVKIIYFYVMSKIIRILRSCSMKIFSKYLTVNISKLNF